MSERSTASDDISTDWRLVVLLYLSGALAALQYAKLPWMLPGLRASHDLTAFEGAVLLSMIGLAGLVGGTVAGAVSERIGETRTLRLGLLVAAAAAAAMALPLGLTSLFAVRALESLSHMAIVVSVPTLMLAVAAPADRARVMTLWSCYFVLTFISAAAVAPVLDALTGWRGFAVLHALLLVTVLAALRGRDRIERRARPVSSGRGAPPAPDDASSGGHRDAMPDGRHAGHTADVGNATSPARAAHGSTAALARAQRRLLGERRLLILPLTFTGYTLLFVALVSHLPTVLAETESGRFFAGFALPACSLVGTVTALYLLRRGIVAWRMLALSAGLLVALGMALAVLLWRESALAGYVSLAVFACLGLLPAGVFSSLPDLFASGDRDLSLVQGGLVQFGNLGNFSGPPVLVAASGLLGDGAAGLFLIAGASFVLVNLPRLRRQVETV